MAKIGVYIAHHRWLDFDFGPDRLYKVGYSTNLDRRLNDSSYTTCFVGSWKYKYVFLVNTQSEAESIETYLLARANRVEFKELVNNSIDELIAIIEDAASELGIGRVIEIPVEPTMAPEIAPIVITPLQNKIICSALSELACSKSVKIDCKLEDTKNIVFGLIDTCNTWCVYLTTKGEDLDDMSNFAEIECQKNVLRVEKIGGQNILTLMRQNKSGVVFCTYAQSHLIHQGEFNLCIFNGHGKRAIYEMTKRPHFRNHVYISNTSNS